MRTLIIEDDPSVSRSIELLLKSRGHTSIVASTGVAGIEQASKHRNDIILLDLSLPDMDGHAVLKQFRARRIRTPVLILSGSDDRQDKIKGLGVGADDYVTKPFDQDELLARMAAILRRATGRTPPPRAANLDSLLLAKHGKAAAWSFKDSYAPPEPNQGPGGGESTKTAHSPGTLSPRGLETTQSSLRRPRIALGPAKIIVFGNGKGGTGKSTIAMHVIVALLAAGHKVASFDCDCPQGTLTRYIANRRRFAASTAPDLAIPTHETLDADAHKDGRADGALDKQSRCNDYVIIDTPGHDTPLSRWAHGYADTLVTPINDSFIDLDVLAEVTDKPLRFVRPSHYSELVQDARLGKPRGRRSFEWIVLRNRLASLDARNRRAMARILAKLCEPLGFREGPGLSERVIYRELFLSGLTLLDLPRDDVRLRFAMSHVAARQELRAVLEAVQPTGTAADARRPAEPDGETGTAAARLRQATV
jgi:chromosome partitioning protein